MSKTHYSLLKYLCRFSENSGLPWVCQVFSFSQKYASTAAGVLISGCE